MVTWCCAQCKLCPWRHIWDRAVSHGQRQFLGLGTNIRLLHSFRCSSDLRKAKFLQSHKYHRGLGRAEGSKAGADSAAMSCSELVTPGWDKGRCQKCLLSLAMFSAELDWRARP